MILVLTIQFTLVILLALLWVRGIDKTIKYEQEHPDADKNAGWLDWDMKADDDLKK